MPILSFSRGPFELRPKFTLRGNAVKTSISVPPQEGLSVQRSLSILLPVRNAQSTLKAMVDDLLDVVSDTVDRFELLIIDDGSTDATSEVAYELTRSYPQIRVFFHGVSLGREAAVETGLRRSRGDVVVLRDDDRSFRVVTRRATGPHGPSRPARPNYLGRLRKFVASE